MAIGCKIGRHQWVGCKCEECDETRDSDHDWSSNCEKCERCEATRQDAHAWAGCDCTRCDAERHDWEGGRCTACGARQPITVFMDPVKAAVEGRGLGVRLNGKSYFLSGEEAIAIHNGLIDQMNEDGTARSAPIRFRTANGEVEIVEEDARQYVEIVGRLARTPAFKLIAG